MEIKRFYAQKSDRVGSTFNIGGDEAHHMIRVLRYKVGYKIIVFDGTGYDYYCTIRELGKDYVIADIDEKVANDAEPKVYLRLFQGIAKSDKMDVIVQKAVELGVAEITPVITSRSEKDVKLEKLEKVALSAAKQCGASRLTVINEPIYLSEIPFENLVIFANENEENRTLRDVTLGKCTKIDLVVGSEGGFTEDEGEELSQKGAVAVTLGKRILRAETAAIVLSSLILYKAGVI